MNFDWRQFPEEAIGRYEGDILGLEQWLSLAEALTEGPENDATSLLSAFDRFRRAMDGIERPSGHCRVFVSHQRRDVGYAERIAHLAHQQGFEYWLDIHDPALALANRSVTAPVVKSILIAAIIEMALLNCSHGISVQTAHAQTSRWVPYEFGRAKQRMLVSTQVASWFDKTSFAQPKADYLRLGVCAHSEQEVVDWLLAEWTRHGCAPTGTSWSGGNTNPLPN